CFDLLDLSWLATDVVSVVGVADGSAAADDVSAATAAAAAGATVANDDVSVV
ncbi:unnamed protein product, partial [Closterium sp. NIES-53]